MKFASLMTDIKIILAVKKISTKLPLHLGHNKKGVLFIFTSDFSATEAELRGWINFRGWILMNDF